MSQQAHGEIMYCVKFSGVGHCLEKTDVHRKIIFIRNAEYYRHTESSLTGSLTSKGKIQAYDTGLYLRRAGVQPTVLFYSDMLRARQTAGAIMSHFPDFFACVLSSTPSRGFL